MQEKHWTTRFCFDTHTQKLTAKTRRPNGDVDEIVLTDDGVGRFVFVQITGLNRAVLSRFPEALVQINKMDSPEDSQEQQDPLVRLIIQVAQAGCYSSENELFIQSIDFILSYLQADPERMIQI